MTSSGARTLLLDVQLRPELTAAAHARSAIREALAPRPERGTLEDLLMVASELVSNSVMHGDLDPGDRISLRLWSSGSFRVEVEDPGRGFPLTANGQDEGDGLGLRIVNGVSERWAREQCDGAKVWAELAAPPPTDGW